MAAARRHSKERSICLVLVVVIFIIISNSVKERKQANKRVHRAEKKVENDDENLETGHPIPKKRVTNFRTQTKPSSYY
jgi:hypothetical protein